MDPVPSLYLDDDDDDSSLPFPQTLPRADFLAPSFEPAEYLALLPHRHQTLKDLQAELRERSSAISDELLAYVNENYNDFLRLGSELTGGDDRVEDVRVSLLSFQRAIGEVRDRLRGRAREVEQAARKLSSVERELEVGRRLLEVYARVEDLEVRLSIPATSTSNTSAKQSVPDSTNSLSYWGSDDYGSDDDDDDDDDDGDDGNDNETDDATLSLDFTAHDRKRWQTISRQERKRERTMAREAHFQQNSPRKIASYLRDLLYIEALLDSLQAEEAGGDSTGGGRADDASRGEPPRLLASLAPRIQRCRATLLLDLQAALREARQKSLSSQLLAYLALYDALDSPGAAIQALRK